MEGRLREEEELMSGVNGWYGLERGVERVAVEFANAIIHCSIFCKGKKKDTQIVFKCGLLQNYTIACFPFIFQNMRCLFYTWSIW